MNHYNDPEFFQAYARMPRSRDGLASAGEWPQLKKLMPDLRGKTFLDLGCGYGWHCMYAAEHGAAKVLGIDVSSLMIEEARHRHESTVIDYRTCDLCSYEFPERTWDIVFSNLALHYVEDLDAVCQKTYRTLKPGGVFLFNIEHPVFTAGVRQEWITDMDGNKLYWPIDDYFYPGRRETVFLGHNIEKQHHTLTQIVSALLKNTFVLQSIEEVMPPETWRGSMPEEMRRPMMLLVKAGKAGSI